MQSDLFDIVKLTSSNLVASNKTYFVDDGISGSKSIYRKVIVLF